MGLDNTGLNSVRMLSGFRLALTVAERDEISRGLVAGRSLRATASALGRSASTLSREVNRNGPLKAEFLASDEGALRSGSA